MLNITNAATAKKSARVLERFMATLGHPLKLGNALDAIGAMAGHTNWAALSRVFSVEAVDAVLLDFEKAHIRGTTGDRYSNETQLMATSGFQLRFGWDADRVDYVRICDPLGREISYWTAAEWVEDPAVVVSAFLGSAGREVRTLAAPVGSNSERVSITAVPFKDVSAFTVDGQTYPINWVDYEVLKKLASKSVYDSELEVEAMAGSYEEDYQTLSCELTLGQLRSMTWSPSQRAFVTECGLEVVFHIVKDFDPAA